MARKWMLAVAILQCILCLTCLIFSVILKESGTGWLSALCGWLIVIADHLD